MGAGEELKGKVKEAAGAIADNDDLRREGQAQQDKGEAQRDAAEARAEAKAHDAKADVKETEQRAAQAAK